MARARAQVGRHCEIDGFCVGSRHKGTTAEQSAQRNQRVARGGKGRPLWGRKDRVARVVPPVVTVPQLNPDLSKN